MSNPPSWSVLTSYGLCLFYIASAVFMFTQGQWVQACGCLALVVVFFMFAQFGIFSSEMKMLREKVLSLIALIDSMTTIKSTEIDKIKIKLMLFQLESEMFRKYGKRVLGVMWMNRNHRPDSLMIQKTINFYFQNKSKRPYVISLTDEQSVDVKEIVDLYQTDLISIYSIVNQSPYLLNSLTNKKIEFK
jgi:hypothetical protein